jgi:hypothetical protein
MFPCRKPFLEALESRILLSGNVAATVTGGVLTLTGDAANNVITLTRVGDQVTITPDAATKINNGTAGAGVDVLSVTGSIKINMGAGNDSLTVAGKAIGGVGTPFAIGSGNGDLTIDLGAGDDQLVLAGVEARDVRVITGTGNNAVTVTGLDPDAAVGGPADVRTIVHGNLTVTGGSGNDAVVVRGIYVAHNVSLPLGNGGNSALVTPYAGSDANFDVNIGGSFSYDSTLATRSNAVTFADPANSGAIHVGGSMSITMSLMADTALITPAADLSVGGSMFISGCYGNDVISVSNAKIGGLLILYGGAGNNTISVSDVSTGIGQWIDGKLTLSSSLTSKLSAAPGLSALLSRFGVSSLSGLGSLSGTAATLLSSLCGLNFSSLGVSSSTLPMLSTLSGMKASSAGASLLSKFIGMAIAR